jgi:hypothetical protein
LPKRTLWSTVMRSRGDVAAVYGSSNQATSGRTSGRTRLTRISTKPTSDPPATTLPLSCLPWRHNSRQLAAQVDAESVALDAPIWCILAPRRGAFQATGTP